MYQVFDTLKPMDQISASALSIAIASSVIYLWLRSVAARRGSSALLRAQSHSFWCALIAFFASTSGDLSRVWSIQAPSESPTTRVIIALGAAGWLTLVYVIGLFTWPGELRSVRVASLEPRTLTTPFPRKLGALVGSLAIFACCMLWPISRVAGHIPEGKSTESSAADFEDAVAPTWDSTSGWISGAEVAPLFALCIFAVLLATAVISAIILKRRPLAGISATQNQELRSIWLNRLLRNCGWLLTNIIGAAITYADPVLSSGWNKVSMFAVLALGIVLFVWAPKHAAPEANSLRSTAFARMRSHTLSVSYFANTFLIIAALIIWLAASELVDQTPEPFGEAGARAVGASFALPWSAAAVVLYLVISAGFALYAHSRAKLGALSEPKSQNLPVWVYTIAALFILSGSILLYAPQTLSPGAQQLLSPWVTSAIIVGTLVAAAGYFWWIRHCAVPWDLTDEQEIWYRQILEFRALRVLCSAYFLLPGLVSSDEPAVLAIGIGLFCIPALLVVNRPKARLTTSVRA